MNPKTKQACGVLMLCACPLAQAMNFNIPTSSSIESAQMGGASLAFPQSAAIASDNPAGMAVLGNRIDGGLQLFFGSFRSSFGNENNRDDFKVTAPIPSGGISYQFDERTTLGLSMYSIGSGSDYSHAAIPGMGFPAVKTKIAYLNFAPTLAYKVTPDLSLGLSALVGVQQVQARGLVVPQADGSLGVSPTHGIATSTGLGWRVGALWQLSSRISLGAAYSPKMRFSDADGYKDDLLAISGGHLDLPEQGGIGIAVQLTPTLTVAADYLRIEWDEVGFFNNPDGAGMNSQDVWRAGMSWNASPAWTLRAGFKHATKAVDAEHTNANYFSPGILNNSLSAGFTYQLSPTTDLSLGYEYEIPQTLRGKGPSTGTNIGAHYSSLLLGLGMRY
ncbi:MULTISPECIES: OmpP1/FadL family transporter [unclassified Pseudomonas]|uniref:OmpP1/FadL family transporter n=1 Tax=unclassified Pseudomonas TaxID=196821 RepID=UPI0025808084|nr:MULTISPECIES: outer membrane protein transport protein [unclassified Pseudomonas]